MTLNRGLLGLQKKLDLGSQSFAWRFLARVVGVDVVKGTGMISLKQKV